jgi:hypothetical protein
MLAGSPPETTWEKQRDKDLNKDYRSTSEKQRDKDLNKDYRGTWEKQKAKGSANEQERCKELGGEKYDSSTVSTLTCKDQ